MAQSATLPGGAPLAPGEVPLVSDRFMYSTIAGYLHTDITLTNRRLYAIRPNTLFGLIPVGSGRSNFPIENIAGVSAATRFSVFGALLGAFVVILGFGVLSSPETSALGVALLIIGAVLMISAPKQAIEVMNSGGGAIRFPVSVFERSRTVNFAQRVSEAVARRPAPPQAAPTIAQSAPSDPTDAIRHLNRLREQGLITDSEYATKRADILGRF